MSETFWWQKYGSYHPWKKYPMLPDPGQVLLSSMDRRGIDPEQRVDYLMDLLDLQKSMIYNILKGEGLDSISRCRRLVRALEIYPPLLGIDARYYPAGMYPCWWKKYGYSFNADNLGYPETHEIIAYFRSKMVKIGTKGKEHWSQEDLGDTCGLKKETIYRMEHDKNPLVFDSMSRRFIVASAFATVLSENASIIFRLLGLEPSAYGIPVQAHEYLPPVHHFRGRLTDKLLDGYQRKLASFFTEYYDGRGEDRVVVVREWLLQLPALMPRACTTAQHVHLLALQSRAHRFLACIARERCEKEYVLTHTNKSIELAKQAASLSKHSHDRTLLVSTSELLAGASLSAALAYSEQGSYDLAREQLEYTLTVPILSSRNLKNELFGVAALIHTYTVTSPMDQQMVLSSLDLAFSKPCPCERLDENFFQGDRCTLLIYKAWALASGSMEGVTRRRVPEILDAASRQYSPSIRQQILIEYLYATSYTALGNYQQAIEFALCSLKKSQQIASRLNRNRIEELYQKLCETDFKGQPSLVALGVKLRLWDCEGQYDPSRMD